MYKMNKKSRITTQYGSSFLDGIGSLLDVKSIQTNKTVKEIICKTDTDKISEDWKVIGNDLESTMTGHRHSFK